MIRRATPMTAEPHAHGHSHAHGHEARTRPLAWTLALVVGYAAAEVIGGLVSGSLALLADAGHMVSDAAALALTLFAMRYARRPPSVERPIGRLRGASVDGQATVATRCALSETNFAF